MRVGMCVQYMRFACNRLFYKSALKKILFADPS